MIPTKGKPMIWTGVGGRGPGVPVEVLSMGQIFATIYLPGHGRTTARVEELHEPDAQLAKLSPRAA